MDSLPALIVAVPLVAAALAMGLSPWLSRRVLDLASIGLALILTAGCLMVMVRASDQTLVYWFGGWLPRAGAAIGISFTIDPFGAGMAGLAAILTAAALVFSWHYFESAGALFHTLMLVFLAAMAGFCFSGDLFTLFVFFELMGITAYGLTGYKIEKSSLEGALNFAITNSLGAFLLLAGIALLYGRTGALNLAQLGRALAAGPPDTLVMTAFVLVTSGILVKAAVVPFHFWLPDAHAVAPTPVCVLLSGVMVELGIYGAARIYWTVFDGALGEHGDAVRLVSFTVGCATAALGGFMCFLQRHLKRLLAFSSISHMGVLLCGFALLDPTALAGAAVYLLAHGFTKGSLFLCVGVLLHTRSSVDELELRGKGRELPATAVIFFLAGLALAGIPPAGLYSGKGLLEQAASARGYPWLTLFFLLSSILTGGAVLRAGMRVFFGWGVRAGKTEEESRSEKEKPETKGHRGRSAWFFILPGALLVILSYGAGFVPGLQEKAFRAGAQFQDRTAYAAAVLDGKKQIPDAGHPAGGSPEKTPGTATAGVAGAILLALGALFGYRLPRFLQWPLALLASPVHMLRSLQSGHIGDYITWIIFGTALSGALFLYFL